MNILFVHQGFPGQYRNIIRALCSSKQHKLVGLGVSPLTEALPPDFTYIRYPIQRGNSVDSNHWLLDIDSKVIRGESCAIKAIELRDQGFYPDLICAHPGWGEALFLSDVWPKSHLLCYQEFYYNSYGFDFDFDPEFQSNPSWDDCARLRLKNANPLLMLEAADWNVTPTLFQRSSFPEVFQSSITAIHDGIDTDLASPNTHVDSLLLPDGHTVSPGDPIVTFVNRRIEPYRGCHTFLRAVPDILHRHPSAHVVVVGSTEGVSYGKAAPCDSWRDVFLKEIEGEFDSQRLHFTGSLPYASFLNLLQISSCHVYLTYPFVLSWSLLEAMSIGCAVVGSATAPVQEVVTHGREGLLVDFFSPKAMADAVDILLSDRQLARELGRRARNTVVKNFSLQVCVPRQLSLMQLVASGRLSSN